MVLPDVRRVSVLTLSRVRDRRRLLLAFALALVIHAIVLRFLPRRPDDVAPESTQIVEHVTITKRTPPPTPAPLATPDVTPQPIHSIAAHIEVFAPAPRAAAPVRKQHGGEAAHLHVVHATPPPIPLHPKSVSFAHNQGPGINNGGLGSGAGAGIGVGGDAGTGSGVAGVGTGNGSDAATQPCGYVDFESVDQEVRNGKEYVWLKITLHLRDGEAVTDDLGWPFIYAGDRDNPFSATNASKTDFDTPMQPPPPDFDVVANQQHATVLALRETGADGYTNLAPCPGQN
ncbi:MAG TPA: hypothetical protein VGD50_04880 [Candidatus Baltobacteraceae bacterium]